MGHDDEPVFKRSKWGTNRYVYNPQNLVGMALIVLSVLFAVVMMILMEKRAGPFAPTPDATPWSPPAMDEEPWPTRSNVPDTTFTPGTGHSPGP